MMKNRVAVETSDYERNHGARPRGFGQWAFCTVDPRRLDYLEHVLWEHGNYGEAKARAKARAQAAGASVLHVCA